MSSGVGEWCAATPTSRSRPTPSSASSPPAQRAPSAGFTQGWGFLVLDTPEQTAAFWNATFPRPSEARAPVHVAGAVRRAGDHRPVLAPGRLSRPLRRARQGLDRSRRSAVAGPYWHIDTGFAAMAMLLAVVDEGLGALFFGIFGEHIGRAAPGVRRTRRVHAHRRDHHRPPGSRPPSPSLKRGHRPADEVVHRGRWQA